MSLHSPNLAATSVSSTLCRKTSHVQPLLELGTEQICVLVAMRIVSRDEVLAELDEDRLSDLYYDRSRLSKAAPGSPARRRHTAWNSSAGQSLQSRVDGAGLVRAGAYALTRLGAAIADYWLELLAESWYVAIETSERLLDETTETLGELKDVLLGETGDLLNLLADIEALAWRSAS